MAPSDAKRMSSRVGVCLVTLVGIEVGCCLKKSGSESRYLPVRSPRIFDVEIEVDLLGAAIWPIRGHMVRCELHPDPPLTGRVSDAVPSLILEDAPSKDPSPECTLCMYIGSVEH
jgi:hypothetical protein